jgi:hypothetical protein
METEKLLSKNLKLKHIITIIGLVLVIMSIVYIAIGGRDVGIMIFTFFLGGFLFFFTTFKYPKNFADLHRQKYVSGAFFGLLIFLGIYYYSEHTEVEKMKESLLMHCLDDCYFEKTDTGIADWTRQKSDNDAKTQCVDSCNKDYKENYAGNYK